MIRLGLCGASQPRSLYTPDNQRLPTATITRSVDPLHVGQVLLVGSFDVRASVLVHTERFNGLFLWAQETESKEHELRWIILLRARHFLRLQAAAAVLCPLDMACIQRELSNPNRGHNATTYTS